MINNNKSKEYKKEYEEEFIDEDSDGSENKLEDNKLKN
jgi:hypothetical protein